jgi:CCR4-NOT transcription complex subunit 6
MFVEYLFEINPLTLLLITVSVIIFIARNSGKSKNKNRRLYEETQCEYKHYGKRDEENKSKNSILVMSYNIMAYNFTKIEWFPYCVPEYLHPKYRAPRILNEIEKVNADILFMQECDHDLFLEYYKVNLEEIGYHCIYKLASTNRIVTNVIAYKKKLFREEKWVYLDLNEELDKIDESFQKHKEAILVTLRHYNSGKNVLVVNTHLFWNPDFEYIKYGQIARILTYIDKNYPKDMPIVFCGDFNSTPQSNILKYVYKKAPEVNLNTKGDYQKNKKYIDLFWSDYKHNLSLRSAYDIYKTSSNIANEEFSDNHPDFTTYTHEFIGTLDYILFSSDKFEVSELLRVPTHDAEVKSLKLPNYKYPSDHLKIGARLKFKN